jgi:cell division protein YceG involved in septum cleavage
MFRSLLCLFVLLWLSGTALADDWADCRESLDLAKAIQGCNQTIKGSSDSARIAAATQRVQDLLRGTHFAITLPDGATTQQIVDRIKAEPFLIGDINSPAEGSLLPGTYLFPGGGTRASLVDRMRDAHDRVVATFWNRRATDLPLFSADQLVILASIVEKETTIADERPRIAAVFINRLRLNMRLQSDPTVIYAKFGGAGKPDGYVPSKDDTQIDSAYNTYTVDGLPPGPIANPGRASLEAVANPARTRDLFFVADGTGGHAFAENYEDHLRNVARWRKVNDGAVAPANADTGAPSKDTDRLLDSDAPPAKVVVSVEPPADVNAAPVVPAAAPTVALGVASPAAAASAGDAGPSSPPAPIVALAGDNDAGGAVLVTQKAMLYEEPVTPPAATPTPTPA